MVKFLRVLAQIVVNSRSSRADMFVNLILCELLIIDHPAPKSVVTMNEFSRLSSLGV